MYDQAMVERVIEALASAGRGGQERWQPNNADSSVSNKYLAYLVLNAACEVPPAVIE